MYPGLFWIGFWIMEMPMPYEINQIKTNRLDCPSFLKNRINRKQLLAKGRKQTTNNSNLFYDVNA